MKKILLSMMVVLALVGAPMTALAQGQGGGGGRPSADLAIPVVGSNSAGSFAGTFTLQRFAVVDGAVQAIGRLTGTVTDATGTVTSIVRNVALPVTATQATCDILHLDLGPLNLNLLGLQIDLSRIVLDITAQAGPGNLLGNLLCAVAGLLDNPSGLSQLLNQILSILG